MRVPYWLAVAMVVMAGCSMAGPGAARPGLQTAAVGGTPLVMGLPVPPVAGQAGGAPWSWGTWPTTGPMPGMGNFPGLPGLGGTYELTQFDGPGAAAVGDVTLRVSGGDYDGCANDYQVRSQVQSGTMAIRLSVATKPANRQCFASGHEDRHTFAIPLHLDLAGTYTVLTPATWGWRTLGTLIIS